MGLQGESWPDLLFIFNRCPWSTCAVISSTAIFSQQYIVWVKIIHFSLMPKIIRILRSCSMKIFSKFPTVNISKLNFLLLICIAKNFIWLNLTLKMIFSIFKFFCILRFQIFKYCPIITNHTSMERLFILYFSVDPYDWFCGPGSHMWPFYSWLLVEPVIYEVYVSSGLKSMC